MLILQEAINNMGSTKYSVKLELDAIRHSVKSLKGIYAENPQDAKYAELEKFMEAYIFRTPEMFGKARYKATKQSLDRARRPAALPDEADVTTLMNHVKSELRRLTFLPTVTAEEYRLVRALTVCRLTLFNGRRGEEPARMLLTEWHDAQHGEWLRMCVCVCDVFYLIFISLTYVYTILRIIQTIGYWLYKLHMQHYTPI